MSQPGRLTSDVLARHLFWIVPLGLAVLIVSSASEDPESAGEALFWLVLAIVFVSLPGLIAYHRQHPSRAAILLLGWVGVFFFGIGWVIALVWSLTGEDRDLGRVKAATPPKGAGARDDPAGPGWFRCYGVDAESGFDTDLSFTAESEANAVAKAELKGMIVTRVERASHGPMVPTPASGATR